MNNLVKCQIEGCGFVGTSSLLSHLRHAHGMGVQQYADLLGIDPKNAGIISGDLQTKFGVESPESPTHNTIPANVAKHYKKRATINNVIAWIVSMTIAYFIVIWFWK